MASWALEERRINTTQWMWTLGKVTHTHTLQHMHVGGGGRGEGGGRGGTQISLSVGRMPATPGRCCSAMSSLMTLASAFACWSEGVQAGALKGVFRTQQRAAPQRSPQQRL
jgi:hypothetical protein